MYTNYPLGCNLITYPLIYLKQELYMVITCKSDSFVTYLPSLYLNNCNLEQVSSYKYLGIILTSKHSWYPHIQCIYFKARKLLDSFITFIICPHPLSLLNSINHIFPTLNLVFIPLAVTMNIVYLTQEIIICVCVCITSMNRLN